MSGVVMVATESPATSAIFYRLDAEVGIAKVIVERPVSAWYLLRRRVRRLGIATALGQAAFALLAVPLLRREAASRRCQIIQQYGLDTRPLPSDRVVRVKSINDDASVRVLQDAEPEVVVVAGTHIIAPTVLEAIGAPFLNIHAGITPTYRGVHGAYWALSRGDSAGCGVTVHLVDAGVDSGPIVDQSPVVPSTRDNFTTYPLLQLAAGLPIMTDAVRAALNGRLPTRPATGESRQWFHPTLREYVGRRVRWGVR